MVSISPQSSELWLSIDWSSTTRLNSIGEYMLHPKTLYIQLLWWAAFFIMVVFRCCELLWKADNGRRNVMEETIKLGNLEMSNLTCLQLTADTNARKWKPIIMETHFLWSYQLSPKGNDVLLLWYKLLIQAADFAAKGGVQAMLWMFLLSGAKFLSVG